MSFVKFLLGIIMLTMGRRLFWLFLGAVGFVLGFDLAGRMLPHQPYDVVLIIALIAGLIGAVLAVVFQKFAIVAGGFLAGGHLLIQVLREFGMATHQHHWLLFIAGGIIGAVLMSLAFGLALIVLSSFMGAILILQALHLGGRGISFLFIVLSALGIAIQYGLIRLNPPSPKR